MKKQLLYYQKATLNSYSQIFFSDSKLLGFVILLITFFKPSLGLSGLSAVLIINYLANLLGYNKTHISEGLYGFNALLLGLAIKYEFAFNPAFIILFLLAIALLLIATVWLNGYFQRLNLPFLSFPFLVTFWIISLSAQNLTNIQINEEHAYTINETVKEFQSLPLYYQFVHSLDAIQLPPLLFYYLKTLAATFFQDSLLAGILLAVMLLYISRIAFSLSLIGFSAAYLFYIILGANLNDLTYHLVGSNFILMSIAVGSFFLIPNHWTYLTVILLTPLYMLLMIFLSEMFFVFQLKTFSLAFSVGTTVFLYFLHHRWLHQYLHLTTIQYYSPEKTIYKYLISLKKIKYAHLAKISLPFWGEWSVSQGYDGKITHLGDWSKALDFVITDANLSTYKYPGLNREDYYCYNKPVLAPYDGYVYNIINYVEDNEISGVNTEKNWGNAIIINHLNGLFSQISHIKKDSFKVSVGDYVTKGTLLAACGNSGRSPEPHIHFQLQTYAAIGAKTFPYPIAYFIEHKNNYEKELKIFEIPKENTTISNVEPSALLLESFNFIPAKKIVWQAEGNAQDRHEWEIFTNALNQTYIYCYQTKSYAYFVNDGTMFYFYDFEGSRKSLLFKFYTAAYRLLLGNYVNVRITDQLPLVYFNKIVVKFFQDFIAPFYVFTKVKYQSSCIFIDNQFSPELATIESKIETQFFNVPISKAIFRIELKQNKIDSFKIVDKGEKKNYIIQVI